MRKDILLAFVFLFVFALTAIPANACSIFRLQADDGTIIVGRSMEFAADLQYDFIIIPRDYSVNSPGPDDKEGMSWKTRYGYVGVASFHLGYGISDGMNEKGLGVAILWYETDMKWQNVGPGENQRALAQAMVGDWVLGNFSTVEEVKPEIQKVKIFKYTEPQTKFSPTIHYIVYDANGGCIVIEYEAGVCKIYDNPLGIMTNAPNFPWHVTNLRQYAGMTSEMAKPFSQGGINFMTTGHGSGMFGIPGDLTPPSRFARMAVLTRFADKQPDAAKTLNLAQHIINTLDIPRGLISDRMPDETYLKETTQWITFRDLTNRIIYFRTYDNMNLRKIDLNKLDLSAKSLKRIRMYGAGEIITDVSGEAR